MKRIRSGSLRETITIQTNSDTRDAYGGISNSWANLATARAHIRQTSSGETQSGNQVTATRNFEVTFRYDPSVQEITPAMRFVWGSVTLEVMSVDNVDRRNHAYVVTAREIDA